MPAQKTIPFSVLFDKLSSVLAVVVCVGIFGGLFVAVIQPEIQKYRPGGKFDVEEKKKIVEDRRVYLEDLKKLNALYRQYGEGGESKLSHMLPGNPDIANIFTSYERFAKKMGVGLNSIDIVGQDGKVKNVPGVREVLISLSFSNVDYAKFKTLLKALEANPRFTDVVSFDISPDSQTASVNVRTYYASDK